MRKSQNRLLKDQNNILSDVFLEVCRGGKTNTLVRRRKMPLEDLVYSMINRNGLTHHFIRNAKCPVVVSLLTVRIKRTVFYSCVT